MKKIKPIFAVATLLVIALVYFWLQKDPAEPAILILSGNIEVTSAQLSFRVPGQVSERFVDEGDSVKTGQIVARLDPKDYQHEVESRMASVAVARAALAELETGYRAEDIGQAEAVLQRVTAEAERIQADFVRQRELFRKEVISGRDFDAAKAAYDGSRASVREAQERLSLLRKGPRRETIDQAQARLKDAEAMLALAQARRGYTTLLSPMDGMVLAKAVEPGELVTAGTPVVTVGKLDEVWMRAYVNETDLGRIALGQKVTVTTDTWPGKKYPGRITFISPEAEFTPRSVQTKKERVKLVYRIKITIPNQNHEMKPGMPADAEIATGRT